MVQVATWTAVSVASSRDVKVTLDFVQVQASIDSAAIRRASDSRCFGPFGTSLSKSHDIVNVLLAKTLLVKILPSSVGNDAAFAISSQLMYALLIHPLRPARLVLGQLGSGQDEIASSILDIDVQIAALHEHNGIEVDLHRVRNLLFDGKRVRFGSAPPSCHFGP